MRDMKLAASKRIILGSLLVALSVPALQAKWHWAVENPLQGAFTSAPNPTLSVAALLDNSFQPQLERYLEDRIGFRSWLIRLRNDLSLTLFHVARSSELVVGRNLVLFQPNAIKSYQGEDFVGEEEIRFQAKRLREVQQALAQRHIPMLFVLAPSKARFQPEDLPDYFRPRAGQPSNYAVFLKHFRAQGLPVLDAGVLLRRWKDTTRYALFPNGGTHWSAYGAALIADTLFRRVEQLGRFDLAGFRRVGPPVVRTDNLRKTDADLSGPLNLLRPFPAQPAAYPTVVFDSLRSGQQRPNLLLVGDSFAWQFMLFAPYLQTLFAPESRFWYYNTTVFLFRDEYTLEGHKPQQLNLEQEIKSRQFLLFVVAEHNLAERGFGFVDDLYRLYFPYSAAELAHIQELERGLSQLPQHEQRLWQEVNAGQHTLADELHQEAIRRYDRVRSQDSRPPTSAQPTGT